MKKTTTWLLFALLNLSAFVSTAQQDTAKQSLLTSTERDYVTKFLAETESGVFDAVKNLTDAQLTYKPDANKWSIEECVKHIAASEINLRAMIDESLKQPLNPDKRAGIKSSDQALVSAIEDRSQGNHLRSTGTKKPDLCIAE